MGGSWKLVFMIAFIFFGLNSCQKNVKNEPWFVLAKKYVEADDLMIRNEAEKRETALEDLAIRDNAASQLLKVPSPPIPKLDTLLHSDDPTARKVALVNIMLRNIGNNQLLQSILDTYQAEDDSFTRFYSLRCFYSLNDVQLNAFGDQLLQILSSEKDENAIITAMPTLIRLDPAKARSLFKKYLKDGSKGLRAAAIVHLKQMSADMFDEVHEELKSEGVNIWADLPKWKDEG